MGCSKCNKSFAGKTGECNYGGFDRENWIMRTNADHRRQMMEVVNCPTMGEKSALESQYGTRYTVLSNLP